MRLAVIADSHFHAEGEEGRLQHGYPSDASFNARNRAAIAEVQAAAPDRVIHLGDIPHPVPGLKTHALALDEAAATYAALSMPLHLVPGNHDVGDKLHPWAPAPSVSVAKHEVFRQRWGPPWWRVDLPDLSLLGIDTPVLNSGLDLEAEQWEWLERSIEELRGRRVFCFMHYPPFLLDPAEDEHYDNLAEPARGRLLDLFARLPVEAAFCGHVHHPFLHHHRGTAWYLLPSTAFVRPGFAELARVAPAAPGSDEANAREHGRNEAGRLGWCMVHVDAVGHRVEWVRSEGRVQARSWAPGLQPGRAPGPPAPLGLTLRHAWDAVEDIPADNLDPYRRKRARNDLALLAAIELGPGTLRLPLSDLRHEPTFRRLDSLARLGFRLVFFTADEPEDRDRQRLASLGDRVLALEWITPRHRLAEPPAGIPVPLWMSVHPKALVKDERRFDHFPLPGFLAEDPDLERVPAGVLPVLRVTASTCPVRASQEITRPGVLLVELPRAGEAAAFTDDLALAHRVVAAAVAALGSPGRTILLDAFMDHDRGYFPRHGLIDRKGDPRPAWWALRNTSRLCRPSAGVEVLAHPAGRLFRLHGSPEVLLPETPWAEGVDLVTGLSGGAPSLNPRALA